MNDAGVPFSPMKRLLDEHARMMAGVAEAYYDSEDADNFYAIVWGGEDIHIGLYDDPPGDIRAASRRTVEQMAARLKGLGPGHRVLDIGAGYGGGARYLAANFGCHVTCLNISQVENARNEQLNEAQGLGNLVRVVHGSFEAIPGPADAFDFVWSQDAILHSGDRVRVLEEVARVLKPGGQFIFTDPMQADHVDDPRALQPIYERIHLSSLASVKFYREALGQLGFEELQVEHLVHQLRRHYTRVREELVNRRERLAGEVSDAYVERMAAGLGHWIRGADEGLLAWGILLFRKARPA